MSLLLQQTTNESRHLQAEGGLGIFKTRTSNPIMSVLLNWRLAEESDGPIRLVSVEEGSI